MSELNKKVKHKKPRSKKTVIILTLRYIFLAVFVISLGVILYNNVLLPNQVDSGINEINNELLSVMDTLDTAESENTADENTAGNSENKKENNTPSSGSILKQREKKPEAIKLLKDSYEDLTGWIEIDNTTVNFPVMQSGSDNPDYYLRRDFKGNYSKYGSIYLDASCTLDSDIKLLYGHSMSDKRMFYCLLDMAEPENLKNTPVIKFDTTENIGDYKIVSVFKTNTRYSHGSPFHYNYVNFSSTEEKMQYIYECMIRSVVDTGVDINEEDEFVLLSTCSYEFEDFRTGVLARKVRPGEESDVDVNNIKKAENPLYPDVWYQTYGGKKPNYPETFKEAVESGLTPWYCGELYK